MYILLLVLMGGDNRPFHVGLKNCEGFTGKSFCFGTDIMQFSIVNEPRIGMAIDGANFLIKNKFKPKYNYPKIFNKAQKVVDFVGISKAAKNVNKWHKIPFPKGADEILMEGGRRFNDAYTLVKNGIRYSNNPSISSQRKPLQIEDFFNASYTPSGFEQELNRYIRWQNVPNSTLLPPKDISKEIELGRIIEAQGNKTTYDPKLNDSVNRVNQVLEEESRKRNYTPANSQKELEELLKKNR